MVKATHNSATICYSQLFTVILYKKSYALLLNSAAFWLQPAIMNFDVFPIKGVTSKYVGKVEQTAAVNLSLIFHPYNFAYVLTYLFYYNYAQQSIFLIYQIFRNDLADVRKLLQKFAVADT